MHEHSVGEILVHIFYADVVNVLYADITCEDRDDGLLNKLMSRIAAYCTD